MIKKLLDRCMAMPGMGRMDHMGADEIMFDTGRPCGQEPDPVLCYDCTSKNIIQRSKLMDMILLVARLSYLTQRETCN